MGCPQDVIFQRPKDVGRGSPQDVGRRRPLVLHRGPYGDVHRTFLETSSARPQSGRKFTEWALNKKGLTKHKQLTFKKKDKIRFISNKDEAAITGITESNKTLPYCTRFRGKPSRI